MCVCVCVRVCARACVLRACVRVRYIYVSIYMYTLWSGQSVNRTTKSLFDSISEGKTIYSSKLNKFFASGFIISFVFFDFCRKFDTYRSEINK